MNVESELLSNVLNKDAMRTALTIGVTADFFRLDVNKQVWDYMYDTYTEPATRNTLPSTNLVQQKFPAFRYSASKAKLAILYKEGILHSSRVDLEDLLEDSMDAATSGVDTATILHRISSTVGLIQAMSAVGQTFTLSSRSADLMARYKQRKSSGGVVGLPYPFRVFDKITGGLEAGTFNVIYGRPGSMKSWLLVMYAAHLVTEGYRVALYTKEVSPEVMLERVASVILRIDYAAFRAGELSDADEDLYVEFLDSDMGDEIKSNLMVISDAGRRTSRTILEIRSAVLSLSPDAFFIDGFYLVPPPSADQRKDKNAKVASVSNILKEMAQSQHIPVIGTSQVNRDGKANITYLDTTDAAFSDAIGQDADSMQRVFWLKHPTIEDAALLMILFKKVREGGGVTTPAPIYLTVRPSTIWEVANGNFQPYMFLQSDDETSKAARSNNKKLKRKPKPRPR